MKGKRMTERFPFLLPLRKKQRKLFFYMGMRFDKNKYALEKQSAELRYRVFGTRSAMINLNSGFDIKYQLNKVDNLKLAAGTINRVVIEPGEVFSFWMLVRKAEKYGQYKDGLTVVNDQVVADKGGGLCQISNMLFWCFLHTPLTVVERHPHSAETIPHQKGEMPGVDATIAEGWLDLKLKNETEERFQIIIEFDKENMYGTIFSDRRQDIIYSVESNNLRYFKEEGIIYRYNEIYKIAKSTETGEMLRKELVLKNKYEIRYDVGLEIEDLGGEYL